VQPRLLAGQRIGVLGKGGAGKSTVTVLVARALRRREYSVLVFDADSTNVGLGRALGVEREPDPILDHLGGMIFGGGRVTCPVDDPTALEEAALDLGELPDRYRARTDDGIWLLVGGKLGRLGPGAGCDGPIAKIARDLEVTGIGPDDVLLVDYKAGYEDSARGAVNTLDWALAVVDPTPAARQLAIDLASMVREVRRGTPPATRHLERPELVELANRAYRRARVRRVLAVLNRIPDAGVEGRLRRSLERRGIPVIGVFPEEPVIGRQWLGGEPVGSDSLLAAATAVVEELERVRQSVGPRQSSDRGTAGQPAVTASGRRR
jgi:CO dehydrogenase maturation factor